MRSAYVIAYVSSSATGAGGRGLTTCDRAFDARSVTCVGLSLPRPVHHEIGDADLLVATDRVAESRRRRQSGVEQRSGQHESSDRSRVATDLDARLVQSLDLRCDLDRAPRRRM